MLYLSLAALLGLAIHREAAWAWLAIGAGASARHDGRQNLDIEATATRYPDPLLRRWASVPQICPDDLHVQHRALVTGMPPVAGAYNIDRRVAALAST